ncbi:hypothetical protein FQN57_002886 [Myotisia sp. PD_48]|nr:hypothetical protein FQN57_002886 [Myotisia sp. PD_48]
MPSKSKDHVSRRKDRDKPRDPQDSETEESKPSVRSRDKERHSRSSHDTSKRTSRTKRENKDPKDRERRKPRTTRTSGSPSSSTKVKSQAMSDTESNSHPASTSITEPRANVPYPTFSKAHSREAVGSRDQLGLGFSVLTPEPTDITVEPEKGEERRPSTDSSRGRNSNTKEAENLHSKRQSRASRPPSPPLTNDDAELDRRKSTSSSNGRGSEERKSDRKSDEQDSSVKSRDDVKKPKSRPVSSKSANKPLKRAVEKPSRQSLKSKSSTHSSTRMKLFDVLHLAGTSSRKVSDKSESSRRSSQTKKVTVEHPPSDGETVAETVDSDATSIAPVQVMTTDNLRQPINNRVFTSTPPPRLKTSPVPGQPSYNDLRSTLQSPTTPPPPPPPPALPFTAPKVDYLLHNGGLQCSVPRNFLGAGESAVMPQHLFDPKAIGLKVFERYQRLLDDYGRVLNKKGSLAVATGYRSVARRLLDRLEAVFARDISSEICECMICCENRSSSGPEGVNWGEVLEIVSGRRDIPPWPPFCMNTEPEQHTLGKSQHIPMQKLDIDVPEKFRDYYVRESQKTKKAVDSWLSGQVESAAPQEEVDDETLAFAMLTTLEDENRDFFARLLEISMATPFPSKKTPRPPERPQILISAGNAIQRLYRLQSPPRDPETALFLVNCPEIHNVLATLAAISEDEWDILISGRFDGFLRSGAEEDLPPTSATAPPWGTEGPWAGNGGNFRPASQPYGEYGSRNGARSAGSGTIGAPISIDEESEIMALAEIERDIFLGMEALEDAFETLHSKAEEIRRALRERGAGLAAANEARRNINGNIQVLAGTPSSRHGTPVDFDSDDGVDDGVSIAPSDSASNVCSNRRRRPKRRNERRTPAIVEEEDDDHHHEHHHHVSKGAKMRR